MNIPNTVCGVLLYDEAYEILSDAIKPYVKEGALGKFIYCVSAVQNGNFIDMKFTPEQCNESVKEPMTISVPVQFVKFMATGTNEIPVGFS